MMVLDETVNSKKMPDAERLELLWKIMQEGKPD
jgi:hypothetical protein